MFELGCRLPEVETSLFRRQRALRLLQSLALFLPEAPEGSTGPHPGST